MCTIIFTIVIANLLTALTIEASERLKLEGGAIQSEHKYNDILSCAHSLVWSCLDKTVPLRKVISV